MSASMNTYDCVLEYHDYAEFMSKRMFCAGAEGRIACSGDSGHGFFIKQGGSWTIYGIVSSTFYGNDGCDPNKPSGFTTVPIFVRWIRENAHVFVHKVVRGVKKTQELLHMFGERRTFYIFEPFGNTTIDTKTHEIASDRDGKVQAILASHRSTIAYLPIKIDEVFPNLISYGFWNCSVKEISKENFRNLRQLERLDLPDNKISSIDKDVFEDLVALRKLILNGNQLTWLHEDTFNNNQALEELYLYQNQFESLPAKLLQNLRELKIVLLYRNKIKTIDVNFFASSLKLEWIWLIDNKIEYLHADTFQGLNYLKNVDLSRNKCIDTEFGEYQGKTYEPLSKLNSEIRRLCSSRN